MGDLNKSSQYNVDPRAHFDGGGGVTTLFNPTRKRHQNIKASKIQERCVKRRKAARRRVIIVRVHRRTVAYGGKFSSVAQGQKQQEAR